MLVILTTCSLFKSSVTMYNNGYGNFLLFLMGCTSGILAVWVVAGLLKSNNFSRWCGLNSIIIYNWQFMLTQFMKNVVEILTEKLYPECPTIVMTVMFFVLCVVEVIPSVIFSNRFIPEIDGKKRMKKVLK